MSISKWSGEVETVVKVKKPVKKKSPPKKRDKKVWAHGNKKDPKTGLTMQQEKFVRFYCGIDTGTIDDGFGGMERRDSMGNATISYQMAYPSSSYHTARSSASDLLANPNIKERVKWYLDAAWWSPDNVRLQHTAVINQHLELPSKMRAIELYYKVTGDLPDEKKVIITMSDEDREAIESVLSSRKQFIDTVTGEIITNPSTLSPLSYDQWEDD